MSREACPIGVCSPQNSERPLTPDQLTGVRNGIAGLLTDTCAKFINQIVSGRTGQPYDAKKDLLTAFDSIKNGKGGFFFGGTRYGGGQSGSLTDGTVKVNISGDFESRPFSAAFTALHEIIHAIAGSDQPLSKQVSDLGIPVLAYGYPNHIVPYPTDVDNRNLAYSGYWGQALRNACDPNGVPK